MKRIEYDLSNITDDAFEVIKEKAKLAVQLSEKNRESPFPPTENQGLDEFIRKAVGEDRISEKDQEYLAEPCAYVPVRYGDQMLDEPIMFCHDSLKQLQMSLGKTTYMFPDHVPDEITEFKSFLAECIQADLELRNKQEAVFEYLYEEFPEEYEDISKADAFEKFKEEDPYKIGLAITYDEETCEHQIEAFADLMNNTISVFLDGDIVDEQRYESSEKFVDYLENYLTFDEVTNGNLKVWEALDGLKEKRERHSEDARC